MTTFAQTQSILDAAVAGITEVPTITTENQIITTVGQTSFTRTQLVPNATVQETIGVIGLDRLNGLFIIDIFYPKDSGVAAANAAADAVTVALESGTLLQDNDSNQVEIFNSYPNGALPELEHYYRKQIVVEWRARRARTV